MVGLIGSSGGGPTEDPVTATFKVLADPVAYQAKYAELLQQTLTAQQATEVARKERATADAAIAQAALDSDDITKAKAECERANDALARREIAVAIREQDCAKLEAALKDREASFTQAAKITKEQLDAARAASEIDMAARTKGLDVRAADMAARQAETERLNTEASALKLDYEQRLAALLAIAGGRK